ncbi:hypothetical protein Oscil6304_2830 [Oscillatoria acuminata PCC 6304]|uniref:Uncharacterized protein n=1 Tax=Oscillatoria acuminata PCC 6304 TaxID=56110 RepID=K9THU3_9CYAN|nr:hypothetical protein Oscil6304_2830 [Oscillatoria acuminata PCC 6304]
MWVKWPESDEPPVCTDLLCIPEKPSKPKDYKNDRADEWEAKILHMDTGMISLGTGKSGKIEIRMRKPGNKGRKLKMNFVYGGAGLGAFCPIKRIKEIPVGHSTESDFEPFSTTKPIKIQDFAGDALHAGMGLVVGHGWSGDRLVMFGPGKHGAKFITTEILHHSQLARQGLVVVILISNPCCRAIHAFSLISMSSIRKTRRGNKVSFASFDASPQSVRVVDPDHRQA